MGQNVRMPAARRGNAQDGLADRTEGDVLLDAAEQRRDAGDRVSQRPCHQHQPKEQPDAPAP